MKILVSIVFMSWSLAVSAKDHLDWKTLESTVAKLSGCYVKETNLFNPDEFDTKTPRLDCASKDKQKCIEFEKKGSTPPAIIGRISDSEIYFDIKTKKPLKVLKIGNLRTWGMGSSHEVIVSKAEPLVTARGAEVRGHIDLEVLIKGIKAGSFEKTRVRQFLNIRGDRTGKVEIVFADLETNGPFAHFLKLRPISDDECGLDY